MDEFELIRRYFSDKQTTRPDISLGIGDDAAVVNIPNGYQLVTAMDTLVSGRHFFADVCPQALGYKALAVNISDQLAMGAKPQWFTLALTLPQADPQWLNALSAGLFQCAQEYAVQLIGGDTTQGPLTLTIQTGGTVLSGRAISRAGAKVGDLIYLTGSLGAAALALLHHQGDYILDAADFAEANEKLLRPKLPFAFAQRLAEFAHSAIDVSDGLSQDLGHLLQQSGVGAAINLKNIPLSSVLQRQLKLGHQQNQNQNQKLLSQLSQSQAEQLALQGGDDYVLCFTVAKNKIELCQNVAVETGVSLLPLGEIVADVSQVLPGNEAGWRHFSSDS